jgi:predicted ATPase/DNA-binding SARP family transcriptional activator
MLRIYLLGSFQVLAEDEPLKFSTLPKTLPLWAYLLLNPAPIARDQLAALFWPASEPVDARSKLRRHLHDLRRALPPEEQGQPWLLADNSTIRWNAAAPAWLDVVEFEQAAADPQRLARAVALYRGDLLPGLYDDWIFFYRERLRNRFLDALSHLVQQAHAQADYAQAIAYAQQILHHDPLREETVRTLMTLRHESGDRAGALQEYQRFAQRLRTELDVPPLLETSALYDAIARQTMAAAAQGTRNLPALPASPVAPAPATLERAPLAPPHNLPAQLTTFIGRAAELAAVQQLLLGPSPARLLTLSGPGGSGKTRLALEVGARLSQLDPSPFPGGVFVVWLATVQSADLVLPAVANTLNVTPSVGKTLLQSLQEYLRSRRLLLILDNLEHLTAAAPQLAELLVAAPGLQIIVTSRILLRIYGEQEYLVPSLALPDDLARVQAGDAARYAAIALFVARSRAVNPNFVLNAQNAATVAAICTRLDGLPLAIELAAARSKLFSPEAILARLDHALTFLSDRNRTTADHRQTLRATLDWSFDLLAAPERQLLVQLALFAGGFTLEQAEAVCDPAVSGPVLDGIEALVNHSLLRQDEINGVIYFRLLATIREYANERLEADPNVESWRRRHAVAFLAFAASAGPKLRGPEQALWLGRIELAHANLRTVLAWALDHDEAEIALSLVTALADFWAKAGHLLEGRQWLARALALPASQPATTLRAAALNAAAQTELNYTDVDHTVPAAYFGESMAISRQIGSQATLAYATLGLAMTLHPTDSEAAQAYLDESMVLFHNLGDRWGEARTLAVLAWHAIHRGDLTAAETLSGQSVAIYTALGDRWSIGYTLIIQAMTLHLEQHDYGRARTLYEQVLAIGEAAEEKVTIATALVNLADLAMVAADYAATEHFARRALSLFEELGELWQPPRLLRLLGICATARGDYDLATAQIHQSIRLNRKLDDGRAVIAGLVALAQIAHSRGQWQLAARQLAAADAATEQDGAQLLPADLAVRQRILAALHNERDVTGLAALWATGQQLTLDEAIAL